MTLCYKLSARKGKAAEVVLTVSNLEDLTIEVCLVNLSGAMPYSNEIQRVVISPDVVVNPALELLGNISLCAGLKIKHAKAVAIALISVSFHTEPGNLLSVRTIGRVGVIAHVEIFLVLVHALVLQRLIISDFWSCVTLSLAEVACLAALNVILKDV